MDPSPQVGKAWQTCLGVFPKTRSAQRHSENTRMSVSMTLPSMKPKPGKHVGRISRHGWNLLNAYHSFELKIGHIWYFTIVVCAFVGTIFGRILLRWWSCVQMDFAKHMETHLKLTTKHVWSSSTGFLHKTYTWRSSYPQSSLHFTMVGMDLWSTTIRGSSLSSDSPSACCTTTQGFGPLLPFQDFTVPLMPPAQTAGRFCSSGTPKNLPSTVHLATRTDQCTK